MSEQKANLCDGCSLWPCGTHAPIGVDGCIVTECANRKPTSGELIATLKAQRDELLAAANRYEFRELQLVEALKAYIAKYGPGYSCTDRLAYDNAIGVLAAIAIAEKDKP